MDTHKRLKNAPALIPTGSLNSSDGYTAKKGDKISTLPKENEDRSADTDNPLCGAEDGEDATALACLEEPNTEFGTKEGTCGATCLLAPSGSIIYHPTIIGSG